MTTDQPALLVSVRDGVAYVELNRPHVHNAIDEALILQLTGSLRSLASDSRVRAVVLCAAGPTFCAGADLNMIRRTANLDSAANVADARQNATLFTTLAELTKPTVARIQGNAFGAGVGLIACCDIAVAVPEAQFALAEVKFGLIPATVGAFVVRAIGPHHARPIFLTGQRFTSASAHRMGLVHEIAPRDELDARIDAILSAMSRTDRRR